MSDTVTSGAERSEVTYQLTNTDMIRRLPDNAWIPPDPANRDRAAFDQWVAAGNSPLPAPVPPPQVQLPQPTTLEADPEQPMDAVTRRYLDQRLDEIAQTFRRG